MKILVSALVIALTACAAGAAAQSTASPPLPRGALVTKPDWLRRPSRDDLSRILPRKAAELGRDGMATIACTVSTAGSLVDCAVVSEDPKGLDFGAAALSLAPLFLMKPMTADGRPVGGGRIQIPIRWRLAGDMTGFGPPMLTSVPWKKAPTFEQLLAAYPPKARQSGQSGRVTLSCRYTAAGGLERCDTLWDQPNSYGFGPAAQNLSHLFHGPPLGPALVGKSIRAEVSVSFPIDATRGVPAIGKPKWLAIPSAEMMMNRYPQKAAEKKLNGRAVLSCIVADAGALSGCAVIEEDPPVQGFGEAALQLTPGMRMTVWTDDGLPTVGGRVRVPVSFRLADAPAASPEPAEKPLPRP